VDCKVLEFSQSFLTGRTSKDSLGYGYSIENVVSSGNLFLSKYLTGYLGQGEGKKGEEK
jgi:hypothetical protein